MRTLTNLGLAAAGLMLLAGCNSGPDLSHLPDTVDASGVVLLDGEPLPGATVVLIPADSEYSGNGITDSNGRFELKAFEGKDGVVPGPYMVAITKTVEVKAPAAAEGGKEKGADEHAAEGGAAGYENMLPAKYASPATSGFNADVPATGVTDLKFELTSE